MSIPSSRLFLGLVSWYGLLIVLGAGLAIFLANREAVRLRLPKDTILDLALWILPIGILGARIYYVVFSWPSFRSHPLSILYIWEGGLAIYGGLIAGFLTILVFCRRRKLSLPMMLDILSPGVVLAQAIGRWGNYFNQEAYGLPLSENSPVAFFPLAVQIQEASGPAWHMATFFYESLLNFGIFCFLMWARRRLFRRQGDVFLFYLTFYAAGRLVIENLRMDSLYMGSAIRVSQLLSVVLCLGALWLLAHRRRKTEKQGWLRWVCLGLSLAAGSGALWFSLGLAPLSALSLRGQTFLLSAFCILCMITMLVLYGWSNPEDVIYAHPQAETEA